MRFPSKVSSYFFPPIATRRFGVYCVLAASLCCCQPLGAQPTDAAPSGELDAPAPSLAEVESPGETLAIPDGRPGELLGFIKQLVEREPEGESEQQLMAASRKVARTVVTAADRALGMKPSSQEKAEAHYFKLQAIDVLQQLGERDAVAKLDKAIAAARTDDSRDVVGIGMKFFIETRMVRWPALAAGQKQDLVESIVSYMRESEIDSSHAQTLMVVADFLANNEEYELARTMLKELFPLFLNHASPDIEGVVPMLEGIARRLDLPGKQLELSGTLVGGEQIDWDQYRGKVVLVDFWATWCGPCLAELPNVLKMHRAYHAQGFEVVGISLDDDPAHVQSFIREKQIPWATLLNNDPAQRGWDDPRAVRFGVTGIPFAMLLDTEGKVVSMNARGAELARQLHQLLGDPSTQVEKPTALDRSARE